MVKVRAGRLEDRAEIRQRALGFELHVAAVKLLGRRIDRDLPRAVDPLAHSDGLAVESDRGRSVVGVNLLELRHAGEPQEVELPRRARAAATEGGTSAETSPPNWAI